ncbi:unnamed protein product [Mytilus coruscus]|uniref:Cadherin domain-containing protein n=1 Tax=Mytilus coruscus TaxID=42192 RepID=A0A6J8AWJ6_MYTCO|nr:unnamed protein product [Mytilus coruscus]
MLVRSKHDNLYIKPRIKKHGVYLTAMPNLDFDTTPMYSLVVECTDGVSTTQETYTVNIDKIKSPTISNLYTMPNLDFDTTPMYSLVVECTDGVSTTQETYTVNIDKIKSPTISNLYTGLVSSSTTASIDYDTLPFSSCTADITVLDGSSSDTKTLTINIANVFEAPSFAKSIYSLSGTESEAGTSFGTPKYDVTDQDGDSVTFGLDCPTLNINTSTGEVTLSVNYDRDDVSVASSVTCDLTVTDGTMTSTATLQVIIYAINDNTPQFSQNSYEFHVSPYGTVGTIVGTITASDADIDYDYAPRHRGQRRRPIHKATVHQWSAWKNKHEMNVGPQWST